LAARDYGVVLDPETLELDLEATTWLREARTAAQPVGAREASGGGA
jgi:hypothetical protein